MDSDVFRNLLAGAKIRANSFHSRVTQNKLASAFFVFTFVQCFVQGIMQSFLFSIDSEYGALLNGIEHAAQMPSVNHSFLEGTSGNYRLVMCDYIPHTSESCTTIFDSHTDVSKDIGIAQDSQLRGDTILHNLKDGLRITSNSSASDDIAVSLTASDGSSVVLNQQCVSILVYPQEHLTNSRREDLTFVLLQFWLLAISTIALIYDSVPHLLAMLGARFLLAGWSAYSMWRTKHEEDVFNQLIEVPGTPCSVEIFPQYFNIRMAYGIPDLILNGLALLIYSYFSLHLVKMFNSQSFQRVGPPDHIIRIYKYFLAVQACLQLEIFVLFAAMGLWIDQLFTQYIHDISRHTVLYEGLFICTTILLIPWLAMGWYAIRREMKVLMVVFLGISIFFLTSWAVMFSSDLYRWTFVAWPNLGCYTVASFILIIASIVLGVICRLNFGKGLAQYLFAEDALASTNFAAEVFEREVDVEKAASPVERQERPMSLKPRPVSSGEPAPTYYLPTLEFRDPSSLSNGQPAEVIAVTRSGSTRLQDTGRRPDPRRDRSVTRTSGRPF